MSKRRLILALILVALVAAGLIGWRTYSRLLSNKELQDAIAEADRLDPGWRLEELEAKRAVIPPPEDSAEQILAIKILTLMSKPWPPDSMTKLRSKGPLEDPVSVEEEIFELPPNLQMNADQTSELRAAVEMVKEPLAKARSLANYRAGRFRVNWSLDYFSTTIPWGDECRAVTNLL